jgi:hypothetical protein
MNRANPLPPGNKADNRRIAREKSVSGVNVKNKVAVSRVAVSKADDKADSRWNKGAAGGNSRRFFIYVQTSF